MQLKSVILLACLLSIFGCESGKQESIAIADEKNEQNFDTKAEEKLAEFVADIVQSSYAEIKLAELAASRSTNKNVQDLAASLVDDYSRAVSTFQTFARGNEIATPVDEGEASKKNVNKLSSENDNDFDRKWCKELNSENKKAIRKLEMALGKSDDEELKRIINASLIQRRENADKLKVLSKDLDKN
jgi:putative membrane protein